MSKLNLNNNEECLKHLAELLLSVKSMKSLCMQKTSLNDKGALILVEGLVRAQNLETLKFDYNKLTHLFLEKLCRKLALVGFTGVNQTGKTLAHQKSSSSSILQSESDAAQSGRFASNRSNNIGIGGAGIGGISPTGVGRAGL